MVDFHSLLAAVQPAGSEKSGGGASAGQIVTLSLSVAVGVVGLSKGLVDYRQAKRASPMPAVSADSLPIVSLTTSAGANDNNWSFGWWRVMSLAWCVIGAVGALVACYWLLFRANDLISVLASLIFLVEFAVVGVQGGWMFAQLRGKQQGDPIDCCEAELVLKGEHDAVVALCRRAFLALEAIRSEGMTLETTDGTTTLSGGRGPWPKNDRGQKITARIQARDGGSCHVQVDSSTLWPSPFQGKRNRENVKRFLEALFA